MSTKTINKIEPRKIISLPLTMEQVAWFLGQLSKKELEGLEEMLDKNFQKMVLSRGKEVFSQFKKRDTISLKELQKSFRK